MAALSIRATPEWYGNLPGSFNAVNLKFVRLNIQPDHGNLAIDDSLR